MTKPRIGIASVPLIVEIDQHIRRCNIRGPFDRFRDVVADRLDGAVYRSEVDDLVKRGLLKIVLYEGNRYPTRDDRWNLCGTFWSANPTPKMIRTLWPERLSPLLDGGGA